MPNLPHEARLTRYRILVSGKVQGVGYRMSVLQVAKQLNLNGWVQNLPDGRVEAVFEGNLLDIEQILSRCRHYNSIAVVRDIAVEEETPEGIYSFEIRH